jgi:two-component system nitrogen regulation response regulator NtrX
MNILLVDDDGDLRRSIGDFLANRGHRVQFATDGHEALTHLEQTAPDLILSDIGMPGMDGIELLRGIRKRFDDLPVILMTGHGTLETAIDALRQRAYDYLKKPVHLEELLACIDRVEDNRDESRR